MVFAFTSPLPEILLDIIGRQVQSSNRGDELNETDFKLQHVRDSVGNPNLSCLGLWSRSSAMTIKRKTFMDGVLIGNGVVVPVVRTESVMEAYRRQQCECKHTKRDPRGMCYDCGHRQGVSR